MPQFHGQLSVGLKGYITFTDSDDDALELNERLEFTIRSAGIAGAIAGAASTPGTASSGHGSGRPQARPSAREAHRWQHRTEHRSSFGTGSSYGAPPGPCDTPAKPRKENEPWKLHEAQMLADALEKYGLKWEKVAKEIGGHRKGTAVKEKWENIMKAICRGWKDQRGVVYPQELREQFERVYRANELTPPLQTGGQRAGGLRAGGQRRDRQTWEAQSFEEDWREQGPEEWAQPRGEQAAWDGARGGRRVAIKVHARVDARLSFK